MLRLRDGAAVTVTDGAGSWRPCRLTVRRRVEPDGDAVTVPAPPDVAVAVAPPKGDRLEWLVQKCTEVGVDRIVLLAAERSVVRWDGERRRRQLDRLRRIATEAAMQSRRVWLPAIERAGPGRRRAGRRWRDRRAGRAPRVGTGPGDRDRARGRVVAGRAGARR